MRSFSHSQRAGVLLSAHYDVSESTIYLPRCCIQAAASKNKYGYLIDTLDSSFFATTLGANNPYNPFGKDVGVSFASPTSSNIFKGSGTLVRPLIGIRGRCRPSALRSDCFVLAGSTQR